LRRAFKPVDGSDRSAKGAPPPEEGIDALYGPATSALGKPGR
jgi:hypothetical protein